MFHVKQSDDKPLGWYKWYLGWGYRVSTMRGMVTVDTKEEVNYELASLPHTASTHLHLGGSN